MKYDTICAEDFRTWKVATATGGIVGMPALVFAEGDRRGVLSKPNDEKSLLLAVTSGMMIIFR